MASPSRSLPTSPPQVAVRGPCDLRCAWCNFSGAMPLPPTDEFERVGGALAQLAESGHRAVTLGVHHTEPTTHPDLPRIVSRARELGFEEVLLSTSGMAIADEVYLKRLRDAGLTDVILTIVGAQGAVTDLLLGRDGASTAKLEAVAACQSVGVRARVVLALLRPTLRTLDEVVRKLSEILAADQVMHAQVMDLVVGMRPERHLALWPRPAEILWVMRRLRAIVPELPLHARSLPSCLLETLGPDVRLSLVELTSPCAGTCSGSREPGRPEAWRPATTLDGGRGARGSSSELQAHPPPSDDAATLRKALDANGFSTLDHASALTRCALLLHRFATLGRPFNGFVLSEPFLEGETLRAVLTSLDGTERLVVYIDAASDAGPAFLRGPRLALSYGSDTPADSEGKVRVLRALHALLEQATSAR